MNMDHPTGNAAPEASVVNDDLSSSLSDAREFLTLLDEEATEFLFQWFAERPGCQTTPHHVTLSFDDAGDLLAGHNADGAGIYVTVNECVGGRKAGNVVRVRALMLDLDGAPLDPVLNGPLPPSFFVETSPGRYQVYWLVDDVPLHRFKDLQLRLATRFAGDRSVSDLPRVVRVPGFYHQKKEPFRSRLQVLDPSRRYTLADVEQAFPDVEGGDDDPPVGAAGVPEAGGPAFLGQWQADAERCLRAQVDRLARTPEGSRNRTLYLCAYLLGGYVGAGVLDSRLATAELGRAATQCGLDTAEIHRTLKRGLDDGATRAFDTSRPPGEMMDAATREIVSEMNTRHAAVMIGGNYRIMNLDVIDNQFTLSTTTDFLGWYANVSTPVVRGRRRLTAGEVWLNSPARRSYKGLTFRPGAESEVDGHFNLWRGFAVDAQPGDWTLLRELMLLGICAGDQDLFEWLFKYFAHMIQKPQELPGVAVVLRGGQGTGKNTLVDTMGSLLGPAHFITLTSSEQLTGRFNGHQSHKLLVSVNEALWAGNKAAEGQLKAMITDPTFVIERKGIDVTVEPNYRRLVFSSNSDWVVPMEADDRRYVVLEVAATFQGDHQFFERLYAQLDAGGREALLHDLLTVNLSGFNPAQRPTTAGSLRAALEQKMQHWRAFENWWYAYLHRSPGGEDRHVGLPSCSGTTWPDTIKSQELYNQYCVYCQLHGERHPVNKATFDRRIRQFCPSITVERKGSGSRSRFLRLPSLAQAREDFDRYVGGGLTWDDDVD